MTEPSSIGAAPQADLSDAMRLDFICPTGRSRFVEHDCGMWRVYQDEADAADDTHFWRAMTPLFYPSARAAIDAAIQRATGEQS